MQKFKLIGKFRYFIFDLAKGSAGGVKIEHACSCYPTYPCLASRSIILDIQLFFILALIALCNQMLKKLGKGIYNVLF